MFASRLMLFARSFAADPRAVSAVAPSSSALAELITRDIGPSTGPVVPRVPFVGWGARVPSGLPWCTTAATTTAIAPTRTTASAAATARFLRDITGAAFSVGLWRSVRRGWSGAAGDEQ